MGALHAACLKSAQTARGPAAARTLAAQGAGYKNAHPFFETRHIPYSRGHWSASGTAVLWGFMRLDMGLGGGSLWILGSQWDQQELSFTLYVGPNGLK